MGLSILSETLIAIKLCSYFSNQSTCELILTAGTTVKAALESSVTVKASPGRFTALNPFLAQCLLRNS